MQLIRSKIYESPDKIFPEGTDKEPTMYHDGDAGAIVFGWYNYGEFFFKEANGLYDTSTTHSNLAEDNDLMKSTGPREYPISRMDFDYPGRLWTKKKVIAFWQFPTKDKLNWILKELSKKLSIDFDNEWRISVYTKNYKEANPNDYDSEEDYRRAKIKALDGLDDPEHWELIPVSKYNGAGQIPKSILYKNHEISPMLKKQSRVPNGIGSKHKNKKSLDYKQAMQSESLELRNLSNLLLEKLLMGEPVTIPELRDILNNKILNFEFVKLDGEVRPAKGTTMMKHIPKEDRPSGLNSPSSDKVAAFYDLDKDAWRSVSNKSKDVVIAADDNGNPKIVVSDKKPKKDPIPRLPTVNGEPTKPLAEPVQPIVRPSITDIPPTPKVDDIELPDEEETIDIMDPTLAADDIETEDIRVADDNDDLISGNEEEPEVVEEPIKPIKRPEQQEELIDLDDNDEEEIDIL